MLTRADIDAARSRIAPHVRHTPLLGPAPAEPAVWLKCEFLQYTGVFKVRGAVNLLLSARDRGELDNSAGVVIASGGNAGLATAYAAGRLGTRATVFVPSVAPAVKVARLRDYGADVQVAGDEFAQAAEAAERFAAARGALLSHAYDLPEVVCGAGTLAAELLDDEPGIDTLLVATGGGGLVAGMALAVDGRARVVAVEPAASPTVHAALAADEPVDVGVRGVAVDSLGAKRVGTIAWEIIGRTCPTSVLVDEGAIVQARRTLWRDYRIAAEHGAATAYAALAAAYRPEPDERVAVVVCGANTDPATLEQ